ncbi:MAG TPA: hypothetical protein VLL77_10540 [Anaerolineales bacterium]|nr:hypothetical protein [Anaerolineales bacterium]
MQVASVGFAQGGGTAPRMYAENEILFPPRSIPHLARARGPRFRDLVDRVIALPPDHPDALAFSLMMIRLDGCLGCETDSYRAMKGCTSCALQSLRRFKGSDQELLLRFRKALDDVRAYLAAHPIPETVDLPLPAKAA